MYRYILFSVLLHASISTSMWLLKDKSDFHLETVSFEIYDEKKILEKSSSSKAFSKKSFLEQDSTSQRKIESSANLNQGLNSLSQIIELQNSISRPYFKDVWHILKKKKKYLKSFSNIKHNYLINFILKKNGKIEGLEVRGSKRDVVNEIVITLSENPELPPIPDEVSKSDLQISYQVEI